MKMYEGHRQPSIPGIQDGKDAERALLGRPKWEHGPNYLPVKDCIKKLEEPGVQPGILERSKIINDLRKMIAELSPNKNDPVKFYTAVGTPLDYYHGVDAYFRQGENIVTMDVSLRGKELHKANVFLPIDFDEEGRVKVKKEDLNRIAKEIARRLNIKIVS